MDAFCRKLKDMGYKKVETVDTTCGMFMRRREAKSICLRHGVVEYRAGGAFATIAYQQMTHPVLVESLDRRASARIDIGQTLIGMHIHPVVVPLRISMKQGHNWEKKETLGA